MDSVDGLTTQHGGKAPHNGSDTSKAAAQRQTKEKRETNRDRVLAIIDIRGGATCDEIEDMTGMSHQTASAIVSTLCSGPGALLKRTKEVRQTRLGSGAKVIVRV